MVFAKITFLLCGFPFSWAASLSSLYSKSGILVGPEIIDFQWQNWPAGHLKSQQHYIVLKICGKFWEGLPQYYMIKSLICPGEAQSCSIRLRESRDGGVRPKPSDGNRKQNPSTPHSHHCKLFRDWNKERGTRTFNTPHTHTHTYTHLHTHSLFLLDGLTGVHHQPRHV